jgi:cation transport regulator ChaB
MTKLAKLIKAARDEGACDTALYSLHQCTSIADARAHSNAIDWIEWASGKGIIPSHFWEAYDAACASAWEAYKTARASAREAYDAACASAWEAYKTARAFAWEAYDAACAPAWEAYKTAHASAWEAYKTARASARTKLLDDAQAWIEEDENDHA